MEKVQRLAASLVFLIFYLETEWLPIAKAQYHRSGLHDADFDRRQIDPFFRIDDRISQLWKLRDRRQTFCGKQLTDTLQLVCKGNFNPMYKKSEEDATGHDFWMDYETSTFPFRSRHLAKALIPGIFKRSTKGIVDECCKKSCSIDEMSSYCSPGPDNPMS